MLLLVFAIPAIDDDLDFLKQDFAHGTKHQHIVSAIDCYAFDTLADVMLDCEICVHLCIADDMEVRISLLGWFHHMFGSVGATVIFAIIKH